MKKIFGTISTLELVLALSACSATTSGIVSAATDGGGSSSTTSNTTNVTSTVAASVSEALAPNSSMHEYDSDFSWDAANVVTISLEGNTITTSGDGIVVDGKTVTIISAGTYSLSGSLDDGMYADDSLTIKGGRTGVGCTCFYTHHPG